MSPVVVTKIKVHIPRNFWCSFSLESFTTNWDECENHRKSPKSKVNRNRFALVRNLLSKKISLSVSCKKVNHWPFALVI